ncbi:MAG: hypothetical protein EAX91_16725 [Candidatus Lokiarchaeota archaeon]|nr:hypothetical protein [Candidatus Lokiarchaeota archaeon]
MKVFIDMSEKFTYFNIFTKKYHRFIIINRENAFKLIDQKTIKKSRKVYSKSPYTNKWSEVKPLTEEGIEQVKSLISNVKNKLTEEEIKHFNSLISKVKAEVDLNKH